MTKQTVYGSNIYYCGNTPKLVAVVQKQICEKDAKYWDTKVRLADMSMHQLFSIHDYNHPEANDGLGEHQKQTVICFDDYFVVDSIKRDGNQTSEFADVYNYSGTKIRSQNTSWQNSAAQMDILELFDDVAESQK